MFSPNRNNNDCYKVEEKWIQGWVRNVLQNKHNKHLMGGILGLFYV